MANKCSDYMTKRGRINPKVASRFSLAQPIYHHRVAHPRIKFHSLHPPPFASIRKGLSLTEFYSGATRLSGRFSEGLLLRRSHLLSRHMTLASRTQVVSPSPRTTKYLPAFIWESRHYQPMA